MADTDPGAAAVARIHSVNQALKEVKAGHDLAVLILLSAAREAASGPAVDPFEGVMLFLSRIRMHLADRLFVEMDRVMKAVES